MTVTALAPPRLSGRLVLPAMAEKNHFFRRIVQIIYTASRQVTI
nr:MAG TPA: hypothetical protein [Caudoviricetes sp.]